MPRCEGRAVGPGSVEACPDNCNDSTVRGRQGDLMLCDGCTEFRFPTVSSKSTSTSSTVTYQTRRKQYIRAEAAHVTSKPEPEPPHTAQNTLTVGVGSNNGAVVTSDDDSPHVNCCSCLDDIGTGEQHIKCTTCCNYYHQHCSGLSSEVFIILDTIIAQSGWVCRKCRLEYNGLKASLTKVTEELADMRTSMAWLFEKIKLLKEGAIPKPAANVTADATTPPAISVITASTVPSVTCPDLSQVQLEIYRSIRDAAKRKSNVVVTWLPESTSPKEDCAAFAKFCEEHLPVKPALSDKGCLRLGKRTDQRPRRLLVHLRSEESAASLLTASKNLHRGETYRNIYINPDLSPAESKLAYEDRQRHRAAKSSKLNAYSKEFRPTASHGTDTNSADYNTQFPSLNAASGQPGNPADAADAAEISFH